MGKQWKQWQTIKITADGDCSHEIKWHLFLGRKAMTNLDSILKSWDITLPTTVHLVKAMVFPVVMYGCESWTIKSWAPKNWCFWTVVLEKTLESSLDCKEIQPVHPKGNQSWIVNGRTDAEVETPILRYLMQRTNSLEKDPDTGKEWRREENGTTEDEMVGWHHWLNGHEFEQVPGDGGGQGNLACCSPRGCKESDTTEELSNSGNQAFTGCRVFGCIGGEMLLFSVGFRKDNVWGTFVMQTKLEIPPEMEKLGP